MHTNAPGNKSHTFREQTTHHPAPDTLKASPSYAVIGQVLRAPIDFTTKNWRVRNFYIQSSLAEYARWSRPEGQPHRDASDALAELSDFDVLCWPSPKPSVTQTPTLLPRPGTTTVGY